MTNTVTNYNQDEMQKAIDGLEKAFLWKSSNQGFDYWWRVSKELKEIQDTMEAKEKPKEICSECGREK